MIHLYHGDGKGKTTAACGLSVRAAGAGMKVLFAQFFKSGKSSEISVLSNVPGITVATPGVYHGRYKNMSDEEKAETGDCYGAFFSDIAESSRDYDVIVLDEAVSAYRYGLIDPTALTRFLTEEKDRREIVLTGRDPAPELKELSDYVTEMKKEKHPFDTGVRARKGIEF